mmetsp:Transcript_49917/g.99371  ORF Transcript_49917/g.99371 Transcript_49917/m.99371 type:complete len:89 (-) Transcript_49917:649-915(-)|eukprot:CAMPEP_0174738590 /NCGR_PEP_ID=MMETSP1094-20130205/70223_1 /TAXON_ID=156173 /ORGANISM="Chrysochromulina brevifilum, Strain UTEX LB 985" /LENGTH=88 /DNA_ID=CAMNT_0015942037 /DNA_START=32 /DNA_END=298 /DNA_ORIENTATION=+
MRPSQCPPDPSKSGHSTADLLYSQWLQALRGREAEQGAGILLQMRQRPVVLLLTCARTPLPDGQGGDMPAPKMGVARGRAWLLSAEQR